MSPENKNKSHCGVVMVITMAITLPLLYVLSIGPAILICEKHPKYLPAFNEFYSPVAWLINNTALQKPLEHYVSLWQ